MPDRKPKREEVSGEHAAKTCAACGRRMEWRKSWAKNWDVGEVLLGQLPGKAGRRNGCRNRGCAGGGDSAVVAGAWGGQDDLPERGGAGCGRRGKGGLGGPDGTGAGGGAAAGGSR